MIIKEFFEHKSVHMYIAQNAISFQHELNVSIYFFVLFLFPFPPTSPVGISPYYQPTQSYVSMTVFACMAFHTELKCGFKIFHNMRK